MNISRLYHTLKHLKLQQWWYRGWYKVKLYVSPKIMDIPLTQAMVFGAKDFYKHKAVPCYEVTDNTFTFLNITHSFGDHINWDHEEYGKLWTYNLNYFAWLNDESLSIESRLRTIHNYIAEQYHKNGNEPYPSSLRGIHWIRFIAGNNIKDRGVLEQLYRDYDRLSAYPEYHIQANHLLENGFSLFYGAHFFNDKDFYDLAYDILEQQLKEQILPDGAHYELSPMYHCIILQRLLECYELSLLSDRFRNDELQNLMKHKAEQMLGWLKAFCYKDGSHAMLGDATEGIALKPEQLYTYARNMGLTWVKTKMKDCGYRKMSGNNYELVLDVGNIMPKYQPGHAHADTFSYCLNVDNKPVIVDTGISTYNKNGRRNEERGTKAHNTVVVNGQNSSDVWDGFRVGKRAKVKIIKDEANEIIASHNGYRNSDIIHKRSFTCEDKKIIIVDHMEGYQGQEIYSYIHFHPGCHVEQRGESTYLISLGIDNIKINISGGTGAGVVNYLYCTGFNKTETAQCLRIHIERNTVVSIEL
jgi:hypothetical protein